MSQDRNEAEVNALVEGISTVDVHGEGDNHRYAQFKNYGRMADNQRARRQEHLQRQKDAREARLESKRNISVTSESAEVKPEEEPQIQDPENDGFMEVDRRRKRQKSVNDEKHNNRRHYQRSDMKGRLMYSEWLIDIPEDLENEWLMIAIPTGKRVLVLAENNFTFVYDKRGSQVARFKSALNNNSQHALLDAILHKNTIYILDYLTVKGCPLEGCEFDCRRVMGSSFLRESELFDRPSGQYKFVELETVACNKPEMTEYMTNDFPFEVDGVLFYYKNAYYSSGQTPLVGWLKPWMLPEILQVSVPEAYHEGAPSSSQEFITEFAKKHPTYGLPIARKDHRRISEHQDQQMDQEQ